jgi:hypothetical protein
MKRPYLVLALVALGFAFAACDSDTTAPSDDITPVKFDAKAGFIARYDQYEVDTSDALGNNPDRLATETKLTIVETTVDTGLTFAGRTGVSMHVATGGAKPDTSYYAQDANGDLYRYNYGFSILNNFSDLVLAIGQPVDMGWVLVARLGKKEGATWTAKDSSLTVQFLGKPVFFKSSARMLADTAIVVGDSLINCRAAEHVITAKASIANTDDVRGEVHARIYISGKYGKVVFDFIRSGKFEGVYKGKFRGLYKIMTFHE